MSQFFMTAHALLFSFHAKCTVICCLSFAAFKAFKLSLSMGKHFWHKDLWLFGHSSDAGSLALDCDAKFQPHVVTQVAKGPCPGPHKISCQILDLGCST